jgi:hypothetical protein
MVKEHEIISPHKAVAINIFDENGFGCNISQIFVDDTKDLEEGAIFNPNTCQVVLGLNYQEFCFIAKEIMRYYSHLTKDDKKLFKEIAEFME